MRNAEGQPIQWLVETKGEIRQNTPLKSEAAQLWCERMSTTNYGAWRYLFVQQRAFKRAMGTRIGSFSELVAQLTTAPPKLELELLAPDSERVARERYQTLLPVYSMKAAAGYFGQSQAVEPEGWIEVDGMGQLDERMFVARAVGRSMEPLIHDGDYCVFRANPVGSRQGKIVLVQYQGPEDPDTGGAFTLKKYRSEKVHDPDSEWRHERITLELLNPDYRPIVLTPQDEGDVRVIAEFVGVLPSSG